MASTRFLFAHALPPIGAPSVYPVWAEACRSLPSLMTCAHTQELQRTLPGARRISFADEPGGDRCGRATSRTKPGVVCVAAHERKSPTRRTGRGLGNSGGDSAARCFRCCYVRHTGHSAEIRARKPQQALQSTGALSHIHGLAQSFFHGCSGDNHGLIHHVKHLPPCLTLGLLALP